MELIMYLYIVVIILAIFFYAIKIRRCKINKRKKIQELPVMNNSEFVDIIHHAFGLPDDYILSNRKTLSKWMKIPVEKLLPEFRITDMKSCVDWDVYENDAGLLIEELLEILHIGKKFSFEELQELKIDTVSDYIYYSAISDGLLDNFGNFISSEESVK
jgi:hypothetical protein